MAISWKEIRWTKQLQDVCERAHLRRENIDIERFN